MITEKQKLFLRLKIVEGKKYDEIQEILDKSRKTLGFWWKDLKAESNALRIVVDKWKKKCPEIDFDKFENWFENTIRECHYCKVTESKTNQLWVKYPDLTKRKRGRTLEIERLEPNKHYSETENLVFACYWCNNAKTDTFSEKEFMKVGKVINEIWTNRLE